MIRITRGASYKDVMLRPYRIYINGVYRGKIRRNKTKEFEVGNGTHEICAKLDWGRSKILRVDVKDSIVDVEVGNSLVVGQVLVNLAYLTHLRHEALWLRVKEPVSEPQKQ